MTKAERNMMKREARKYWAKADKLTRLAVAAASIDEPTVVTAAQKRRRMYGNCAEALVEAMLTDIKDKLDRRPDPEMIGPRLCTGCGEQSHLGGCDGEDDEEIAEDMAQARAEYDAQCPECGSADPDGLHAGDCDLVQI